MSLLILSFDLSSDQIGRDLYQLLNSSLSSNWPHVASFCSSKALFGSSEFEKIFAQALKVDSLSHNDLLGFIVLIDVATTSRLHLNDLPMIERLLKYLHDHHPFQSILTFVFHAHPTNQLYTSPLTCFDLNFILFTLYPFVQGILFYNIDGIVDHQTYHFTLAQRLASIFQPVSSLRENSLRFNQSVCVEFLQLIQHLLANPEQKLLIVLGEKIVKKPFQSAILIQRGQPSTHEDGPVKNLDRWNSLEKISQTTLIVNSRAMVRSLLETLIVRPCQRKMAADRAYFYWLRKKFDCLSNIEDQLNLALKFYQNIVIEEK